MKNLTYSNIIVHIPNQLRTQSNMFYHFFFIMFFYFFISFIYSAHFYIGKANSTFVLNNTAKWPVFVRLWASWCHHCRHFSPIWDELTNLSQYKGKLLFASIECEQYRNLCKLFPGENYPRLYWWDTENQKPFRYLGERSLDHITDFIDKQLNFPLIEVNETTLEKYENRSNITTSFLFDISNNEKDDKLEFARNISILLRDRESPFLLKYNNNNESKLIAISGLNIKDEINLSECNLSKITSFIDLHSTPFMVSFNPYILKHYQNLSIPFLLTMNRNNSTEDYTDILIKLRDIIPISSSNCNESEWFCRYTSTYQDTSATILFIVNWKLKLFWIYDGTINVNDIKRWILDVKEGRIKGKGPGTGFLSGMKESYYNFLADGKRFHWYYLLYLPGIIFMLIIWFILIKENPDEERKRMKQMLMLQNEIEKKNQEVDETKHLKSD